MYPKTFDSKWAVANKDLLSLLFRGTAIIGDGHFWKAGQTIKDPAIIGRPSTQVKGAFRAAVRQAPRLLH